MSRLTCRWPGGLVAVALLLAAGCSSEPEKPNLPEVGKPPPPPGAMQKARGPAAAKPAANPDGR